MDTKQGGETPVNKIKKSTPTGTEQKKQTPIQKKNKPSGATPPKAKPPILVTVTPHIPIIPPVLPPSPDPEKMCFDCFNGEDEPHFKGGVNDIVNWLKANPDYNLKITADGGSSTAIKDTWQDAPYFKNETYEEHTNRMFKRLKDAVNAAGGDGNRIIPQRGNADGRRLKYEPVKR